MRKIGNQLVPLFVAFVVVLPSACRDATDLAETTSQDAEMTAAEIEALEIEALWLRLPGNDREFNRLLVEELRTGVPMDWDEALRAMEADGRRFPRFRVVNDDELAPEQIAEADAAEAETWRSWRSGCGCPATTASSTGCWWRSCGPESPWTGTKLSAPWRRTAGASRP